MFVANQLIGNRGKPHCVTEDQAVSDALEEMIRNDYSQLPIVNQQGQLTGIISEQTISRTLYHLKDEVSLLDLRVNDCRDRAITIETDQEVFEALDKLKDAYALVVVEQGRPVGIVTSFDATEFVRQLAEGFALVRDIEETLREYADAVFIIEEEQNQAIKNAFEHLIRDSSKSAPEYTKLTFGDYVNLFVSGKNWARFEQRLEPKKVFQRYMEQVRDVRNQLAHFRDDLQPAQRDLLKRARDWLRSRPTIGSGPMIEPVREEFPKGFAGSQGKYGPLQAWLVAKTGNAAPNAVVDITFDELEVKLDAELPKSARELRAWWANDVPSAGGHSLAWMEAGWRVAGVDFDEGRVTFRRTTSVLYQLFFHDLLTRLKERRPGLTQATRTYAMGDWYFSGGRSGLNFGWSFSSEPALRAELMIDTGDKSKNKEAYDRLFKAKGEIEAELGRALQWDRLDDHQRSRIFVARRGAINMAKEELEELKSWALDNLLDIVDVFQPRIRRL